MSFLFQDKFTIPRLNCDCNLQKRRFCITKIYFLRDFCVKMSNLNEKWTFLHHFSIRKKKFRIEISFRQFAFIKVTIIIVAINPMIANIAIISDNVIPFLSNMIFSPFCLTMLVTHCRFSLLYHIFKHIF